MATPIFSAIGSQFDLFGNPIVNPPPIPDPLQPQGNPPATPNLLSAVPRREEQQQEQPKPDAGSLLSTAAAGKGVASLFGGGSAAASAAPATPVVTSVAGVPTMQGIGAAASNAILPVAAAAGGGHFLGKPLGEAIVGGRHFDNRGANIGTGIGGAVGAIFGGPIGSFLGGTAGSTLGGMIGGLFGSKKSRREQQRDGVKNYIRDALGPNATFMGTGARHLKIEDHRLNLGDDPTSTDPANPLHVASVALIDPIGQTMALAFANQQGIQGEEHINSLREDFTALFARSVADGSTNEEDVMNNTLALAHKFGLTATDIKRGIAESYKQQHIDWARLRVYAASFGKIMGKDVDTMTQEIRQAGGF